MKTISATGNWAHTAVLCMSSHTNPSVQIDATLYDDNYSLIQHNERLRAVSEKDGSPTTREDRMREYFEALGFLQPAEQHMWEVQCVSADKLELPPRLSHAGKYEWIGHPSREPPKWLWDSHESCTVRTNEALLREGYTVVSYTWGRWKIGERIEPGTPVASPGTRFRMQV